ncbi:MAG: prepilin-type N-terminal cleavage/methylation domain-containing protein [Thermoleophilaceae bacterium]
MAYARADEAGFTLIEVMVAITLLLVGVLGTVTMIDGANAVTTQTKAREGATAVGRSVLEIARGVPYRELTDARILEELEARSSLADAQTGTAGHQIGSRNFVYTLTPVVCSMDDAEDDLGDHDELAVTFCPETDTLAVGETAVDRNPDDYRRVSVKLDWAPDSSRTESVTQLGIVTNPVGGLGPSVTDLSPDTPATVMITSGATETASYDVTTSAVADSVAWSVNGARLGDATGADMAWQFEWSLGPADTPNFVDCTYVLQAEAFDEKGRAGTPNALTVTLNRRQPFAPPNFAGGRNLNGAFVDVQWDHNQECDVNAYRVYRGTDSGAIETLVCTRTKAQPTECVDEAAPSGVTLYYQVVAVDTPAEGRDPEGDRSGVLTVHDEGLYTAPTAPPTLEVCAGGNPGCNDIDGNLAPSGTTVLSWDASTDADGIQFYRVYRDGNTYADRLDILFPVSGKPLVFVDATASGSETYYVSAVDSLFGESALTGPVSLP